MGDKHAGFRIRESTCIIGYPFRERNAGLSLYKWACNLIKCSMGTRKVMGLLLRVIVQPQWSTEDSAELRQRILVPRIVLYPDQSLQVYRILIIIESSVVP